MRSNTNKRTGLSRIFMGTVLSVGLAVATVADAQQPRQDRQGPGAEGRSRRGQGLDSAQIIERRVSRLNEHLKLNSGQTTAIRRIFVEEYAQMKALRPQGGPRPDSATREQRRTRPDSAAREQNRAQMKALRDRTNTRIEAVLTSEQRSAYRDLVQNRGERSKDGSGRRGKARDGG
ncbi:MAG: Spy/CpxP family protein refolding chaperone [Anaerolineae bacterium]|nr:Spy/CpxP family protein refolding chaperone [Gemmatimonadaceae bacterium]